MIEPTPVSLTGFEKTKAFLESKVQCYPGTIYDFDPKWLGHFDIVLCLGVIYHLRDHLLGLDNIRRVCRGDLFVESATLEIASWTSDAIRPSDDISPTLRDLPFLKFFEGSVYFNDKTNWFVPTRLQQMQ